MPGATLYRRSRRAPCYKRRVRREFSAGAVVVRRLRRRWMLAAIRPAGKPPGTWALPKGIVGRDESPETAAVREMSEETGVSGDLVGKLGDVRYVYSRGGQRIFKIVSFYLVRWTGGRLGDIAPSQRREVAEARWLPVEEAPSLLAYRGERDMAERARAALSEADNGL